MRAAGFLPIGMVKVHAIEQFRYSLMIFAPIPFCIRSTSVIASGFQQI